jgi:hypothetical protein
VNRHRLGVALSAIVSLLALGALASLLGGRQREVSIDVWIAVVGTWLAIVTLHRLIASTPLVADRLRMWMFWKRSARDARRNRGPELVVEGLLISARDNERAMALRLRPRLIELAGHLLRTRHGIDLAAQPDRAAEHLGDLWWLIDERDVDPRSPSFHEIDELLDLLLDERDPDAPHRR